MTSLSIRIMASPPRLARARGLLGVLREQAVTARDAGWAVADPLLSLDQDMRGARAGAADAWAAAGGATHHLVVQDDVEVCPGFVTAVVGAVAAHPAHMISFCSLGRQKPQTSALVLRSRRDVVGAQAIVMPTSTAKDVASYLHRSAIPTDDQALTVFLQVRNLHILVVDPSLVRHDVSMPSLIGHGPILARLTTPHVLPRSIDAAALPWRDAPIIREVF